MSTQIEPSDKKKFHKALLAFHGDLNAIKKDGNNPHYKSGFVPLPSMLEMVNPLCQKHGFILSQPVDVAPANGTSGYRNVVFSQLTHAETGINEMAKLVLPEMEDMQKLGGAITYARRYTLSALLGLREVDDDGNTATGKKSAPAKRGGVKKSDNF